MTDTPTPKGSGLSATYSVKVTNQGHTVPGNAQESPLEPQEGPSG